MLSSQERSNGVGVENNNMNLDLPG
jgi:hypothetical protein